MGENNPLGILGENAFADICNKFGCEHLHIRQGPGVEYSDKMRETGQKRPDFLVNIPNLTSLFVDVKVRPAIPAGVASILSGEEAFSVDFKDFLKMKALENRMRISTWYAFIKKKNENEIYGSKIYLVPLSRVEKNIPSHIREKMLGKEEVKWDYIRIPFKCMNDWDTSIDLSDKCRGCPHNFCLMDSK